MFWKFDLHATSHIDTLLERDDVRLTDVMDEEDVLQECKAQNHKLVAWVRVIEIIKRVLFHFGAR